MPVRKCDNNNGWHRSSRIFFFVFFLFVEIIIHIKTPCHHFFLVFVLRPTFKINKPPMATVVVFFSFWLCGRSFTLPPQLPTTLWLFNSRKLFFGIEKKRRTGQSFAHLSDAFLVVVVCTDRITRKRANASYAHTSSKKQRRCIHIYI